MSTWSTAVDVGAAALFGMLPQWPRLGDLAKYAFPGFPDILTMKGLYPSYARELFATFTTIVCLCVAVYVQFRIEHIRLFVPLSYALIVASGALLLYVAIHYSLKKKYQNLKGRSLYGLTLALLLFLFWVSMCSFTYFFNMMENLAQYDVYYGRASIAPAIEEPGLAEDVLAKWRSLEGTPLPNTTIQLLFGPGQSEEFDSSIRGYYAKFVPKDISSNFMNGWAKWNGDLQPEFHVDFTRQNFHKNQFKELQLRP